MEMPATPWVVLASLIAITITPGARPFPLRLPASARVRRSFRGAARGATRALTERIWPPAPRMMRPRRNFSFP